MLSIANNLDGPNGAVEISTGHQMNSSATTRRVEVIPEHIQVARRSQRRRKRLRVVALAVGLVIVGLFALLGMEGASRWRYSRAVEAIERSDSGWRHDAIEAARRNVPARENSAPIVLEADGLARSLEPPTRLSQGLLTDPVIWLTVTELADIRSSLEKVRPAIERGRAIADYPVGRYDVDWSMSLAQSQTLTHLRAVQRVADWLLLDAAMRAHEGDTAGAFRSATAILNVARSIGDEPLVSSQVLRLRVGILAATATELTLAHGVAPERTLKELRTALLAEVDVPTVAIAVRGERAMIDRVFTAMIAGEYSPALVFSQLQPGVPTWQLSTRVLRANQTALLRLTTELVNAARAPEPARSARLQSVDARVSQEFSRPNPLERVRYLPLRLVMPSAYLLGATERLRRARLRCALVALSFELRKRQTGRYPDSLGELAGELPADMLLDPYTSGSLRVKTLVDGLVIYSVGPDGNDDGGIENRQPGRSPRTGTDVAFRVLDPAYRHPTGGLDTELPADVFESLSP